MRKVIFSGLIVLMLLSVQSAFGWGQKGHDIIANLADRHLTTKARKAVNNALENRSMVYYASWMDNIRNMPEYEMTKTWHYGNVDEGETYESMKKEPKGDVLTALNMVVETLKDHKNISDSVETLYVRFIIHLVGDMHCPMHAGRLSDRGGNSFTIRWFGKTTNLHSVWDTAFIESSRKWSYTEWADNIDYVSKYTRQNLSEGTPYEWFMETVAIAKQLYAGVEEGGNYSWDYMFDNFHILESQLRNAGYRLASLLNEIYK